MKNFTYKNLFIKSQIERKIIMNQKDNIYSEKLLEICCIK